jgi:hypothetical protein
MSPQDAAQWMVIRLNETGVLEQSEAAYHLFELAPDLTFDNRNGNTGIRKDVLAHFNQQTKETVVWSRSYRQWRWREPTDEPGRMQY